MEYGPHTKPYRIQALVVFFGRDNRILFWNVQGLRKNVNEIECYLKEFEVVALLETWVEEKYFERLEASLPREFEWIWVEAVRAKQRGRPAGGILVGVKKGL